MPYKVYSENGKHCVHKQNADHSKGELVKCHDSAEKAAAHARALYANVEEDKAFAKFSMSIVKANIKDGEMRWRSVNSDVGEDLYGEKMSKELFQDFIRHIDNGDEIPAPFKSAICEEEWCGGMPYISLAHYKSGGGKVNVPGEPKNIYMDGEALKSTGILYDTPLGRAVFKSLQKDLTEKRDDKIRVSIGFLDLEHSHGDKFTFTRKSLTDKCRLCKEGVGDKIYKKGFLVHLALTRVPANPRTDVEVEKSMTTKREDAESIVEDEEVIKGLDLKSTVEEVLVIKAVPEGCPCKEGDQACIDEWKKEQEEEASEMEEESASKEKSVTENTVLTPEPVAPAPEPTAVEKSFAALVEKMANLKAQGAKGENALAELQKSFDELGNVVKAEFTPPPTPEELAKKDMEITLRSALEEMLPQALAQVVAPLQSELAELRALSQAPKPIRKEETPQPRNLTALVQKQMIEKVMGKTKDQFQAIADASVGLPN